MWTQTELWRMQRLRDTARATSEAEPPRHVDDLDGDPLGKEDWTLTDNQMAGHACVRLRRPSRLP